MGKVGIIASTRLYIVHQCILQRSYSFMFRQIYQSRVDLGYYCFCELWESRTALVERCPFQPVLLLPGYKMCLFLNFCVVVEGKETHLSSCVDVL